MLPAEPSQLESTLPEPSVGPPVEPRAPQEPGPSAAAALGPPGGRRRGGPAVVLAGALVAVLAGTALFVSGFALGARVATTPGTPPGEEAAFGAFWDAYRAIKGSYVGEVDQKALVEGAIGGMIGALEDPYSSYMTSEEYRRSLQGLSGQFEGIGAEIGTRATAGSDCATLGPTCAMVVIQPTEGAPAEAAGLRAGDEITAIDGIPVAGLTLDAAVAKIRGPKGTTVTLTVMRGGGTTLELAIVRAVIQQKEVTTRSLAGGQVAYIRLAGFSDTGAAAVAVAIRAAADGGGTRLILDLRGNTGGLVTAARSIASQFVAAGPIYWQETARGGRVAIDAQPGGAAVDARFKVAVLIDGGTASASEIVAGALQDTGRATLIGEKSFGKGSIQEWLPLPDDTGGFRLTIAKWFTPKGRSIHGTGLTPDIEVNGGGGPVEQDPVVLRALEVLGAPSASRHQRAA